jgi:trigger factor
MPDRTRDEVKELYMSDQVKATLKEEVTPIQKKIEVEIASQWIEEELGKAYKEIGKTAKIKGFRQGKVPRDILEKHYEPQAQEKAVRQVVERAYPMAIQQLQLMPVDYPQISITKMIPKELVVFEAVIDVKPKITEVKSYKSIKVTKDKISVSDDEINERIQAMRESMARLVPIEDDRCIAKGDVATLKYDALVEGKPFKGSEVDNYQVELGVRRLLPTFEEELFKMKIGDRKKIELQLPEDYSDKKYAGKQMSYDVTIQDAKKKVIPEADDELAKSLGENKTLQELKDSIRNDLTSSKDGIEKTKLKRQIIEHLVKKNKFDLPQGMIQAELNAMFQSFSGHLQSQGVTLEQAGLNQEEFNAKNIDDARLRVNGMLLFEAIAIAEGVEATDEDIKQRLDEVAKANNQPLANVEKYYKENNMIGYMQAIIREEKTLDFVLTHAKIKEK